MKSKAALLVYILSTSIAFTNFLPVALNAQTTPPQVDQARAALRQGKTLLKRGRADQALGYFQTALRLFTEAKKDAGIGAAQKEFGELYERQGQYGVALDHYKKAHEAFRAAESSQGLLTTAVGLVDNSFNANLTLAKIGDMNYRQNKLSEASAAYGQMNVQKPEGAVSSGFRKFGVLSSIASGSVTSAVTGVGMEAMKELQEYRKTIIYATHEIGMGRIDYFHNQLDSAKKHFENALSATGEKVALVGSFGQTRRFRVAARTSLGDVALRQNRFKDATKFYTEALSGAQKDKRLDLQWPAQRGIGKTLWMQAALEKNPQKAAKLREDSVAAYREALKTIETIRQGSLRADESRTTFLATTKDVFDEASSDLAEMALGAAASSTTPLDGRALEYAAEAFKVTEQSRARSLLDLLNEINAEITAGVPADLLKRRQDNLERQQEIAELLTGVNIVDDAPKKSVKDLDAELDTLQTEFDALENQIRTASPRYSALVATQPLTLAEVQQQILDDQTALIEYSLGNENSYLWAATRNGVTLYKLPARSVVEKQATELRAQLIPAQLRRQIVGIDTASDQTARGLGLGAVASSEGVSAFAAASHALYKTLAEPAASVIGDKRLLVVADGALNYVPFEALVTTSGGTDYASLPYLIKTNEIVYAPSASVIAAVRQQANKTAGRGVLVVADPVFNSNDLRARGVAAGGEQNADTRGLGLESALTDVVAAQATSSSAALAKPAAGLPLARLNGTRMEAEQIAQLAKASGKQADVWLDLNASEANVETRDIKSYRVVHIATHGLLNAERPQFTGVVLSLVGNKGEDGFLRTDEIFNIDLGSPLVMLSACETGLGREKRGEGIIGLTRAFMYAGAPTVGVSLWSVADRSTADLMTDFYKRLLAKEGTSPVAAMRAAQTAMIAGKKYSAPFYWAPFVLVGEWR